MPIELVKALLILSSYCWACENCGECCLREFCGRTVQEWNWASVKEEDWLDATRRDRRWRPYFPSPKHMAKFIVESGSPMPRKNFPETKTRRLAHDQWATFFPLTAPYGIFFWWKWNLDRDQNFPESRPHQKSPQRAIWPTERLKVKKGFFLFDFCDGNFITICYAAG